MFRKNRKAKAAKVLQPTARAYEVWYRDSVGRWIYHSKHSVRSDANVAARAFTLAATEVREIH